MSADHSAEHQEPLSDPLIAAIEAAKADPVAVDLRQILQAIEPFLQQGSEWEQLQMIGNAIVQIAEIYESKAEQLFTDWEERHSPLGPPMQEDLLRGLVQRTMYLDVSELVKKPTRRSPKKQEAEPEENPSIAQVVEKEKVLAFLDAQEETQTKAQALAVAHDENVSQWVKRIEDWILQGAAGQEWIPFLQLQQGVGLSVIKVWLALLLGGFELRQQGQFYDNGTIGVRARSRSAGIPE